VVACTVGQLFRKFIISYEKLSCFMGSNKKIMPTTSGGMHSRTAFRFYAIHTLLTEAVLPDGRNYKTILSFCFYLLWRKTVQVAEFWKFGLAVWFRYTAVHFCWIGVEASSGPGNTEWRKSNNKPLDYWLSIGFQKWYLTVHTSSGGITVARSREVLSASFWKTFFKIFLYDSYWQNKRKTFIRIH
jgi:hypothetical protein